jgi:hypothetical protein
VLERVTPSGEIDTSFGQNGQAFIGGVGETVGTFDPQLTANGNILVPVLLGGGTDAGQRPTVLAISPDGQELQPGARLVEEVKSVGVFAALPDSGYLMLDAGYNLGVARPNLFDINLDTSGGIFVGSLGYRVSVILPDGWSDPDSLLAVQPDGKFLLAGTAPAANSEQAMFVARLSGLSRQAVVELPPQHIRRSARTVTLRLTCSPAQACDGKASLYLSSHSRHRRLAVGSGYFSIAPGHSREVVVTLTHSGRVRLGEHAHTRVTLTLALSDEATRSGTIIVPGAR